MSDLKFKLILLFLKLLNFLSTCKLVCGGTLCVPLLSINRSTLAITLCIHLIFSPIRRVINREYHGKHFCNNRTINSNQQQHIYKLLQPNSIHTESSRQTSSTDILYKHAYS